MPATAITPTALHERSFDLPNETATDRLGRRFAHALMTLCTAHSNYSDSTDFPGLQAHLIGALGAGKTALVRATLRALGHIGRVRSPTYTLVEPYLLTVNRHPLHIYHFDLYRFSDPAEWVELGFRDYFNTGALCLVEWPQQAGELIGVPDLSLTFEMVGTVPAHREQVERRLIARAFSPIGEVCINLC